MINTEVNLELKSGEAIITFSSSEGLNALSLDVIHSFGGLVAKIKNSRGVRVTIVRAKGKVFLAGADANELSKLTADNATEYAKLGQDVMGLLASLPCITIAAINGAALGGGLEVALACDFRIAVKSAKLGFPELSLGITPAWGGIARLTKLIGPSRAKRLYLSANRVSAEEGYTFGLVNEVVNSAEDLGSRVSAFCRTFHAAGPDAMGLAKRASRDMDEVSAFSDCFHTTQCHEGIAAFLAQKPAPWLEKDRS